MRLSKNKVKEEKLYKASRAVLIYVRRSLSLVFLLTPAILFPQFKDLPATGEYEVVTASYTLEDKSKLTLKLKAFQNTISNHDENS